VIGQLDLDGSTVLGELDLDGSTVLRRQHRSSRSGEPCRLSGGTLRAFYA
jgi:hypothetical protein